jgi:hypothetical protein
MNLLTPCPIYQHVCISGNTGRGSLVIRVSDYGLDDWAIEVRSPVEAKDFSSSLCVQTGSGAPPTDGYWGSSPGGKARPGRKADPSP